MSRPSRLLLFACLLSAGPASAAQPAAAPSYASDVAPFLAKHCTSCHRGAKPKGGVTLDFASKDEASVAQDKALWEKVADTLRAGDMPPAHKARPTGPELDAVNHWLDAVVFHVSCEGAGNPGRVTLHRLNRIEYNNTVHDLLGITVRVADSFPSDDVGYGFDNIGDVLSMSPLLMEKYLAAAERVVREAWKNDNARRRILGASLDETADPAGRRKIIRTFTERAWRRPVSEDEMRRLLRLVDLAVRSGDAPEVGIQLALRAVLVSPNFLFRVELDPAPKPKDAKGKDDKAKEQDTNAKESEAKPFAISDWELASRLSYFLWSSMPDDELFRLARSRELHKPEVLEAQTRRMLKDDKARALVDNFAMQWLQLRNLKSFFPDTGRFPKFTESLRKPPCRRKRRSASPTSSTKTVACWKCSRPTTPSSTNGWQSTTASGA